MSIEPRRSRWRPTPRLSRWLSRGSRWHNRGFCRPPFAKVIMRLESPLSARDPRSGRPTFFPFLLAAFFLLDLPALALADEETAFPRGDGFYFSIPKLLLLVLVYLAWIGTSRWVDQDAHRLRL